MSKHVYSEINLHITWHTKNNGPVLSGHIEQRLYRYLEHQIRKTKNAFFHAVGGIEDHVHLVVTVPPSLLISEWIGKLKGGSSFYINHEIANRKVLDWQTGYGVVSFGTKDLKWVIEYVKNQKQHHQRGTTVERLERTDDDEDDTSKGR
jgi:putative transposase